MKDLRRLGCLIAAGWLFGTAAGAQAPSARSDREAGQRLASGVCAACHVVSPTVAAPPKMQPPAPSFVAIANKPGVTAKSLRKFMLTTHASLKTPPNMPSMLLSDDEASALASYILSLKTRR